MAFQAGKGVIDLTMRSVGIARAIPKTQRLMGAIRAAAKITAVAFAAVGAAAVAIAVKATRVFVAFEKEMNRVAAISGATGAAFQRLEATARELGRTTVFAAGQSAQAMSAFALMGFKTDQILGAMVPTLRLAAAGQMDMSSAAMATAGIMRGMKLEISDLTHVTDVLAKAATSSATDIGMVAEAMRAVGPIAQSSGQSLEQTVGVIMAFSDVMIQGSSAGMALRNILLRLQSQPTEVRKAFELLNISIEDTMGGMRPLADIVDDLNRSYATLGEVQRAQLTSHIAGMRASAAFTELLSLGGERIREYTKALEDSGGTAERIASTQMSGLYGAFVKLQSATEGLMLAIGGEMQEVLKNTAQYLQKMAASATRMESWRRTLEKVLYITITLPDAITLVWRTVKHIATAIGTLVISVITKNLEYLLSAIHIAMGWIPKLGDAIGKALAAVKSQNQDLRNGLKETADDFKESWDTMAGSWEEFSNPPPQATDKVREYLESLKKIVAMERVIKGTKAAAFPMIGTAATLFKYRERFFAGMKTPIAGGVVRTFLKTITDTVTEVITPAVTPEVAAKTAKRDKDMFRAAFETAESMYRRIQTAALTPEEKRVRIAELALQEAKKQTGLLGSIYDKQTGAFVGPPMPAIAG